MDRTKAYDILNLQQNATEDQVKSAYKELAQKHNPENYEAGPLREQAEAKMNEINEAFDTIMSFLRTGHSETQPGSVIDSAGGGRYAAIRQMINTGKVDEALAELSAVPNGGADAEWNFLMGSAYYYKGWLEQALRYFQIAVQQEPGNREYEAALRNLAGSAKGNMQGNPFLNQNTDATAVNCNLCDMCTLMCCMDACCSMGRGC